MTFAVKLFASDIYHQTTFVAFKYASDVSLILISIWERWAVAVMGKILESRETNSAGRHLYTRQQSWARPIYQQVPPPDSNMNGSKIQF